MSFATWKQHGLPVWGDLEFEHACVDPEGQLGIYRFEDQACDDINAYLDAAE